MLSDSVNYVVQRSRWERIPDWFFGVGLLLLSLLVYFPALRGGILWDDPAHITPLELQNTAGLWKIWFQLGAAQQYYPILQSAFWVEHKLWGDHVLGYHLINIILHVGAGCLFARLLRKIRPEKKASNFAHLEWLAAAIFVLHPVCVETVAWISEQKNTLSTVFYLASALLYFRFDHNRSVSWYLGASGLFVLALMSKSVTATLPAALLVIQWYRKGELQWRRDVFPLAWWFLVGAGAGLFTAWVEQHYIGAQGSAYELSLLGRTFLAGRAVWFYLGKLFWPAQLIFIYPHWEVKTTFGWSAGLIALGLMTVFFWRIRTWSRAPLATLLIFVGTLFPVLGFLNVYPFIFSYVADHWQYLACLAPIALVGEGATVWADGFIQRADIEHRRLLAAGLSALFATLLVTLAVLTWRQADHYRNGDRLYRVTLQQNPDCWMADNNLGLSLMEAGDVAQAAGYFKAAILLRSNYSDAHNNLGNAFAKTPGRMSDAADEYTAALRTAPADGDIHYNLGSALASLGKMPEAARELQWAAQLRPSRPEIHLSLGLTLAALNQNDDALREFKVALNLDPTSAIAHFNLGRLLRAPQEQGEAFAHYRTALQLSPHSAEIWNSYGAALLRNARGAESIAAFNEAVRLQPQSAHFHNNLGLALRETGRVDEAIGEFQESLRLEPTFGDAHYNLGLALQKLGRLEEADTEFKRSGRD